MTRRALAAAALAGLTLAAWTAARAPDGGPPEDLVLSWPIPTFARLGGLTWVAAWAAAALLSRRPRAVLARAAAGSAGLVLSVLFLETPAWLGWVDWSAHLGLAHQIRFTRIKPWRNPANLRDEELLFRHRPLTGFHGYSQGDLVPLYGIATDRLYRVDVEYDENGFRNPRGLARADLVLLGDSFLEWGLVADAELLSARLERRLGRSVANLGHSGYGPQQEEIVLRRYGLPLRPGKVLWFFFEGNDLLDSARYLEARGSDGANPERTRFAWRSFSWNALLRLSAACERPRRIDSELARSRSGLFERARPPVRLYFAFPGAPLTDEAREQLARFREILVRAVAACREGGAELALLYVPIKFRVHEGLCAFEPGSLPAGWTSSDLPRRVEEVAGSVGAGFLDLTPALRAAAERGELVYLPDDGHWSARGHAVAAEEIARWLAP